MTRPSGRSWQDRAAAVAAYREITGYASPADAIGPPPPVSEPEARAAWHTALAALGRVDGIDLTGLTERELQARRDLYARETAWAPAHVGRELRVTRQARYDAAARRERAEYEAQDRGGRQASRGRHAAKAGDVGPDRGEGRGRRGAVRRGDGRTRRLAPGRRADAAGRRWPPTWRPAAAIPGRSATRCVAEPASGLIAGEAEPDDERILAALGLTPDTEALPAADHPRRMAETSRAAQARADEIAATLEPSEDPDLEPSAPWTEQRHGSGRRSRSGPRSRCAPPSGSASPRWKPG